MPKWVTKKQDIDNIHHHKRYKSVNTIENTNLFKETNINRRQKGKN
jgi:hypothetical protein